jgi:hypothetical protein
MNISGIQLTFHAVKKNLANTGEWITLPTRAGYANIYLITYALARKTNPIACFTCIGVLFFYRFFDTGVVPASLTTTRKVDVIKWGN